MQNSFPLSRDLNPWPLNMEEKKLCRKGEIRKEPRNCSHWPPGLEEVTILLIPTLFKLIWSMYIHQSCHPAFELTAPRYRGRLMTIIWNWNINRSVSFLLPMKKKVEIVCPNQSNYNSLAQSRQQPFRECLPAMTSDLEKLLLHKNPFCCFNWVW